MNRSVLFCVVHDVGSELTGFGFFAVAGSERVNFTTPFVGKLQAHVAETTEANNSHSRRGRNLVYQERREHSDASAKQRTSLGLVKCVRQRARPRPLYELRDCRMVAESRLT